MHTTHKIRPGAFTLTLGGILVWLCLINPVAQAAQWTAAAKANSQDSHGVKVKTGKGNFQRLDSAALAQLGKDAAAGMAIEVPLPEGGISEFVLRASPVVSKALAERYPAIKSYQGHELGKPHNTGRFSITHKGLSGIFRHHNQWVLISPVYQNNPNDYVSYYYQDAQTSENLAFENERLFALPNSPEQTAKQFTQQKSTGETLRTYRLALSSTAEYTARVGGSKADAVAEMVSLVNRVNQILLIDIAIRFELIDNDALIFTDASSDPYTNSDQATDIETNQQIIDQAIGPTNYDLGHLLGTHPGGLAYVGSVCNDSFKAQGYSGNTNPRGERFYIDLVIHELGHQLGAKHSFNAQDLHACDTDQRSASTAFEPGSGSTIMSYSGICGEQNIQSTSDPYFHAGSIRQILNYVQSGLGRTCAASSSLSNAPPQVELAANSYIIPANTPFVLFANASDADGDSLVYNWEQLDAGGLIGSTATAAELQSDNGANPLFRSYPDQSLAYRYFPKLVDVLANRVSFGEAYPTTNRELNFRVSVKDAKGGVNTADVAIEVINSETTFSLIEPNDSSNWQGNSQQLVRWSTGGTELAPINCLNVDIRLDLDGDNLFDSNLISDTANDGEQLVRVPSTVSDQVRLQLQCSDNVFYAVNPGSFIIESGPDPVAPSIVGQQSLTIMEDSSLQLTLALLQVSDPDSIYPENFSLKIESGNNYSIASDGLTIIPDTDFNGELSVAVKVNDGIEDSAIFPLSIVVSAVNDAPLALQDAFTLDQDSAVRLLDVLANDSDIDGDSLIISVFEYTGKATVAISDNQISYQPPKGFAGIEIINYTVSDDQLTSTVEVTITVVASPIEMPSAANSGGSSGAALGGVCAWFLGFILFWRRIVAPNWQVNWRGKQYAYA